MSFTIPGFTRRLLPATAAVLLLAGCGSSTVTVPITVQSDPLGAFVLYRVATEVTAGDPTKDWVYLGTTPVEVRREIGNKQIDKAEAFILRVIKEGYFEQEKAWSGEELVSEVEEKGRVFWNPRLVSN